MSRLLRVSTLGTPSPNAEHLDLKSLVQEMIAFWREQITIPLADKPDVLVLPEYSDSFPNFSPQQHRELAVANGEQMLDFWKGVAREYSCHIVYPSMVPLGNGRYSNATRLINRQGEVVGQYAKNHPTIGEIDEYQVRPGQNEPIIECELGRVACVTCFDLQFDELRAWYAAQKPDIIFFSSLFHGGLLQAQWAFSCRAHFVSALGRAGLRSAIINPVGQTLATTTIYQNHTFAVLNLDCAVVHLDGHFQKLHDLKAKYQTRVSITDPDHVGAVLVASQCEEKSADDFLKEFEIETLDEYLNRSRQIQKAGCATIV